MVVIFTRKWRTRLGHKESFSFGTGHLFSNLKIIVFKRLSCEFSFTFRCKGALCNCFVSRSQLSSAGFTYRLDRLKPRVSKFRWPPVKVYNIFNSVIGLPHLCCHNVLYFLNNPLVVFLAQF